MRDDRKKLRDWQINEIWSRRVDFSYIPWNVLARILLKLKIHQNWDLSSRQMSEHVVSFFILFIYLFVFYFHLVVFSLYRSIMSNIFWCSNYFINCNMFIICLKSYKLAREYQFVKKDKLYLMIWTGHGCWRKWWETPSIKIPSVCSRKIFQPRFCYVWVFMFESVRFARCRSFWTFTSVISVVSILPQTFLPSGYWWRSITMGSWIRTDKLNINTSNWQHST